MLHGVACDKLTELTMLSTCLCIRKIVTMSASKIEMQFDGVAAARAYWAAQKCKCGQPYEVRYCASKANYGFLHPHKDDECCKSCDAIHGSCIAAEDGLLRCECDEVPQEVACRNTKNGGRSFYACEACDVFLWVDPNITLTPIKTPTKSPKRKASDIASSSPSVTSPAGHAMDGASPKKPRVKGSNHIVGGNCERYELTMPIRPPFYSPMTQLM